MPSETRASDARDKRPLIVGISAGLFFIGGVALLGIETFAADFDTRFPPLLIRLVILGAGIYQISTAVALWRGESRGWWMVTAYLGFAFGRAAGTALAFPDFGAGVAAAVEAGEAMGLHDPRRYLARLPLNLLLLGYFFTSKPERFLSVDDVPRARRLLVPVSAVVASFALFTVLGPPGSG